MPRFPKIFSQKNKKPNKLNLFEMWELYTLLDRGEPTETLLVDEVVAILAHSRIGNVKKSIQLMFGEVPSNPLKYSLYLIRGISKNRLFDFREFMEKLNGK